MSVRGAGIVDGDGKNSDRLVFQGHRAQFDPGRVQLGTVLAGSRAKRAWGTGGITCKVGGGAGAFAWYRQQIGPLGREAGETGG